MIDLHEPAHAEAEKPKTRSTRDGKSIAGQASSARILREVVLIGVAAMMLGAGPRLLSQHGFSFPSIDGGMFFSMARDLQAEGFRLPVYTSYNASSIPFAYPPLGLYATALVGSLLDPSLLRVMIWLPMLVSLATTLAVFRLARLLLGPGRQRGLRYICLCPVAGKLPLVCRGRRRYTRARVTVCSARVGRAGPALPGAVSPARRVCGYLRRADPPQPSSDGIFPVYQRGCLPACARPLAHRFAQLAPRRRRRCASVDAVVDDRHSPPRGTNIPCGDQP